MTNVIILEFGLRLFFDFLCVGIAVGLVVTLLRLFYLDRTEEIGLKVLGRVAIFLVIAYGLISLNKIVSGDPEAFLPHPAMAVMLITILLGLLVGLLWWLYRILAVVFRRLKRATG